MRAAIIETFFTKSVLNRSPRTKHVIQKWLNKKWSLQQRMKMKSYQWLCSVISISSGPWATICKCSHFLWARPFYPWELFFTIIATDVVALVLQRSHGTEGKTEGRAGVNLSKLKQCVSKCIQIGSFHMNVSCFLLFKMVSATASCFTLAF